ncbi:hypothetical protein GH5_04638 [Leishmania sp. Ghana 2012 LV757]|uniref:hypothetical protein n=1 Tax=Leishmania sp. Ghana 2012 LV757 TaxID=2803181 RepID=UPI001B791FE1|nr:hypothetical protein GH5_04638 [Leishmania sp. Ghana 2012 LV757]
MNATDPYSLSPQEGAMEMTLFQMLFPTPGTDTARVAVGDVVTVETLSDSSPGRITGALAVPSPSASERIRAWETVPGKLTARSLGDTVKSESECYQELTLRHSADARSLSGEYAAEEAHVSHTDAAVQDRSRCADNDAGRVPFPMCLREVERRFREQMEVHRGLAAASRQIDVLERSVHMFQAERRTRAFVQALTERQDAIWTRVWPGSSPPRMEKAPEAVHRRTGALLHVVTMPTTHHGDSTATPSTSSVASPQPPGSPTGSLLKDIISAYSKSRELVGASSGSSRSAAVAPLSPTLSKANKGAPLAPARRAQRNVAGVQIFRPEEAPKPYTVTRYVAARSKHVSATHGIADRQGSLASLVGASVAVTATSAESPERHRVVKNHSRASFSTVVEEYSHANQEGAGEASDQSSDSVADAAASIEDTYGADTFDSHVSSEKVAGSSMSSAESSIASASISTEGTASSPLTHATACEDVDRAAVGRRARGNPCYEGERRGPPVAEDARAAPFAEVLHAFFDACRCVSAASAQVLQSPYIRERSHNARHERKHTSQPARKRAASSASSLTEDAGETAEAARGVALSATDDAITGADVSGAAWHEELHRQLRNVRRLQRFRHHLLRHLKRIDLQRQTRRKAARLLRETQALAKARRKLLSGSIAVGEISLESVLRHVKAVSKGTREERRPRRGGSGHDKGATWQSYGSSSRHATKELNDDDTIPEVLFTGMNSSISGGTVSADSDQVEEELQYGSHESLSINSDSIVKKEVGSWDGAPEYSKLSSGSTVSSEVSRSRGGDGELSYRSNSFEAASHSDAVEPSGWIAGLGAVAQGGLDEIEEELAERLAELSSGVISEGNSIPSSVEELVDLLPSSLIPSDMDNDAASSQGSSAATLVSSVATDMRSSEASLQIKQRRIYVGVKGSAARYAAASGGADGGGSGVMTDHKTYLCDAPTSGVYSVPEDADVDTSMLQSTDIRSEGPSDSLPKTSNGRGSDLEKAASVGVANKRQSQGQSSATSTASSNWSSSSEDALAWLEVDMSLTKERRRHALCSASDVPTFEQLYNPFVRQLEKEGAPSGDDNSSSSDSSSRSPAPDRREGGPEHSAGVVGSGAVVSTPHEQGAGYVVHYPTTRMEAGTQAEMHAADRHPAATSGVSPMRTTYPAKDYVAQMAWKARQLHILQQLRSSFVDGSEDAPESSAEVTGNPSHGVQGPHQPPKNEADAALDAAESAAREEWAQHWGIVESLLQTRFSASSRADGSEPPQTLRHTGTAPLWRFPSDSTASSRDASPSNAPVSSASR